MTDHTPRTRGRKPLLPQERKVVLRCFVPAALLADLEGARRDGEQVGMVIERWWQRRKAEERVG